MMEMELDSPDVYKLKTPCFVSMFETWSYDPDGDDRRGTSAWEESGIVVGDNQTELLESMANIAIRSEKSGYKTTFSPVMAIAYIASISDISEYIKNTSTYSAYVMQQEKIAARIAADEARREVEAKQREAEQQAIDDFNLFQELKAKFEPGSEE